ncbi:hypothetical protein AVEN_216549-1 [Araneus ventricosus]|uniref:Uncharacterized protein n=1 Tax=Araneus ventricosus TaxID=182803 RepID=A0A4Y2EX27_ARAVE|nr:hypothetical protein AVEN_216549-1 [Araneus ventricosus]
MYKPGPEWALDYYPMEWHYFNVNLIMFKGNTRCQKPVSLPRRRWAKPIRTPRRKASVATTRVTSVDEHADGPRVVTPCSDSGHACHSSERHVAGELNLPRTSPSATPMPNELGGKWSDVHHAPGGRKGRLVRSPFSLFPRNTAQL